eukprot:514144_1
MSSNKYDYVIVGGGVGGGYACRSFVKLGLSKVKSLCMISSEDILPYERPTLAHGFLLKKNLPLALFNILSTKYCEKNNITVKLNTTVTIIDYDNKIIRTDTGESISYNKLLLATGCSSVKFSDFFPDDKCKFNNIYYLRNLSDAKNLKDNLVFPVHKNENRSCVVIGGGYIGMEVTSSLIRSGCMKKVTMIFPEQHMMAANRLFNDQIAEFYHELYERNGVEFICYSNDILVTSFEGDNNGNVQYVNLKNGLKIPAQIVIVGIGARPNTSLFDDTLEMHESSRGLKVNRYLQSVSNSDVYGCGDIIAFRNTNLNRTVRLEHVRHARASGTYAMKAMSGKLNVSEMKNGYEFLPVFFSRVFGQSWIFYGNIGNVISVDFKFVVQQDFQCKVYAKDVEYNDPLNDRMFRLCAVWYKRKTGQITGVLVDSDDITETYFAKDVVKNKRNIKDIANFVKQFLSNKKNKRRSKL